MVVTESSVRDLDAGWDEYVASHSHGTLFHTTRWGKTVERFFPHRSRYLEVRREGQRAGVLPLFETRSILSGRGLVSVPYAVYGGPIADDEEAERALWERLREIVDAEGFKFAEVRCQREPAIELPGSELYLGFVKDLPDDPEECLKSIPRKSRATARQARDKHGLRFEALPDRVADFHRLFVLNKQKLGSPAFSRGWFDALASSTDGSVQLHGVLRGDELLMAVLSFCHGKTFNPYSSGSVPQADRLGASNFAYWQLMVTAVEQGYRSFDFGRSRAETGPWKFKKNMGFEPETLAYRYVLGLGGKIPEINPGNPKFSLPRRIIQKMPLALVKGIGPILMRWVP